MAHYPLSKTNVVGKPGKLKISTYQESVRSHMAKLYSDNYSRSVRNPIAAVPGGSTLIETRLFCKSVAFHFHICQAAVQVRLELHATRPLPLMVSHYTTQYYIILHYTILHYITLNYTPLHNTTLPYTTPHYTTLHYTTLQYTKIGRAHV